ncbi:MAG: extradiol ring-cleavage dioxygenase [Alphaproteobacteria bacterium]|nr:extradiol ring-cleavage dioxygenase [Alphaproteobacteria bacterium]
MARIVLGIGTSHTPLLSLDPSAWHNRAKADYENPRLTLADGRSVTYAQLVALRGEPYASAATPETFVALSDRCQKHLDHLAAEIAQARPDLVVIVGDDQAELYTPGNIPAFAIFCGDEIATHPYGGPLPAWRQPVAEAYAMDKVHRFPASADFARRIVESLIDQSIDVTIATDVPEPEKFGFGHAFGFPIKRLFGGRSIPILPVMLNTYFPPNVPTAARCLEIGRALRTAIEAVPGGLNVAVLASGGLSHFVVEEELDRMVIDNLGQADGGALGSIPREALLQGSSEILNWVVTAGVVSHLPLRYTAYEPLRRTPAGTGVGAAFAVWKP